MTGLFHILDGDAVVLYRKGTFRQSEVYQRNGELFAKHSGGFIRLLHGGHTSLPDMMWEDLHISAGYSKGPLGRLVLK